MKNRFKRTTLFLILIALSSVNIHSKEKPNILFIAIDDLKPLLGAYGEDYMHTPNIDKLASSGVVYTNSHCQQAVCGPSRASIMTGMRPDYTGVRDLKTRMRDINPDILTIPQHFKANGYTTVAIGKIYDPRCVGKEYDKESWSIPYKESSTYIYPEKYGEPALSYYALEDRKKTVKKLEAEAIEKGENKHAYVSKRFKPSVEKADVPDEAYIDGQITNNALRYMKDLKKKKKPFFLAVGFKRPHLPFSAPSKYWDLYQRDEVKLADYPFPVNNGVDISYHSSNELESYTDIPPLASFTDIKTMKLPIEKQRELIHGYYAAISFIDAQVGKLLNELEKQGLDKNTVIVLWGDHGWHLGDHNLWCKHSNFEHATRVPLIISTPCSKTGIYKYPTEFVDVFPTLTDLAGIPTPSILQGKSLKSTLTNVKNIVKPIAVSQFSRGKREGYSIRSERFRLTLWMNDGVKTYQPFNLKNVYDGELYDYKMDPNESQNLYKVEKYEKVKNQMFNLFEQFINNQNLELANSGANPLKSTQSVKPVLNSSKMDLSKFKVIQRNGADAELKMVGETLQVKVNSLGEKPWNLQLTHKATFELTKGEKLTINLQGSGGKMKFSFGSVEGVGMHKLIDLQTGKSNFKISAKASSSYSIKIQLLEVGTYQIQNLDIVSQRNKAKRPKVEQNSLIQIGKKLSANWKSTVRKGGKADFNIEGEKLISDVKSLGERQWDLQLSYKKPIDFKAGQTLVVKYFYSGPEMKINLGPVGGERIGKIIKQNKGKKIQTLEFPISKTGNYPVKFSFMNTGRHTI